MYLLSSDQLQRIRDETGRFAIAPTAGLMAVTYLVATCAHLLVVPAPRCFALASVSAVICILSTTIYRMERLGKLPSSLRPYHVMTTLALLLLFDFGSYTAIQQSLKQTSLFAMVMVGCGLLITNTTAFSLLVMSYSSVWLWAQQSLTGDPLIFHYRYTMGMATVIAIGAHFTMYRTTMRATRERLISDHHREQAENRLREQQEKLTHVSRLATLGEMAAGIAHELNQPLSAIALNATAAELRFSQGKNDPQKNKKLAREIKEQAIRAGHIISHLRQLSSNQTSFTEGVDLNQVVQDSVELLDTDLQRKQVDVDIQLMPDLPKVNADEIQLQQVVINFVQNAMDSMLNTDHSARITVRTKQSPKGPQVSVIDNGGGVAGDARDRVFEAFYTTKPTGLGMGLAICRSIVEKHGGKTWWSDNEEQGAAFHFSIPLPAENLDGASP